MSIEAGIMRIFAYSYAYMNAYARLIAYENACFEMNVSAYCFAYMNACAHMFTCLCLLVMLSEIIMLTCRLVLTWMPWVT